MVEIDRVEALPKTSIADDGKAGRISQGRSPDTQADRLQRTKQSENPGERRPKKDQTT
jgi:hypothetical protein